jgi:hypothetical protein
MPSKPAINKETKTMSKETAPSARKTSPRVSTAKHRAAKSSETSISAETNVTPGTDNSRELIAAIAYGYWESRGYQGGDPMEDWVRAEAEFNGRTATTLKAAAAAV